MGIAQFKSFTSKYDSREQELLVLRYEGGYSLRYGKDTVALAYFLAYVDVETGVLHHGEGCLAWPVTEPSPRPGKGFGRFAKETIYRVKARALSDRKVKLGMAASFYNQFYVTEILEQDAPCPALEALDL